MHTLKCTISFIIIFKVNKMLYNRYLLLAYKLFIQVKIAAVGREKLFYIV